ncbi:MAG: dihydrofolate reductase family protein, partial [Acutalibacteraceae bacterium]
MKKPYVVCHMLSSLDGKIDGTFFSAPDCTPALRQFGKAQEFYNCNATLYGTTTMEDGYANGRLRTLPNSGIVYPHEDYVAQSDVKNYIVSVDPKGILAFSGKYIEKKNRPKSHIIEVLTERVSDAYLTYLRDLDISYIFAGDKNLDCGTVLDKLYGLFGIEKLMISGGGLINWSFMQENLIDEVSLVLAPVAD